MSLGIFLSNHGIIGIIVAYAIGGRIAVLTECFFNDMVIPILDVDWNRDGVSDKKQLSNLTCNIGPIKLRYGRFILCLLNIIISIYVIFGITYLLQRFVIKK